MNKLLVQVSGLLVLATTGWCQVTQRVSLASNGEQGDGVSFDPAISTDGRWVAFVSAADNFAPGVGLRVYVRDRQTGTLELVSVDSNETPALDPSDSPSISADGRYVAFLSYEDDLVPGDTNQLSDIFVRDRQLGTTERVSVATNGAGGNNASSEPSISADGRYVAFTSRASNFLPGDVNNSPDIFVRDRDTATTWILSIASNGAFGNNDSLQPAISADGRYVAFSSTSSNLVANDTNGLGDVFVRDRDTGTTERVSLTWDGGQANWHAGSASISATGRFVAFHSDASNFVAGDTNQYEDVFLRDRVNETTERVSVGAGGEQGNFPSIYASISGHGRYVAFESSANNLVPGDIPGLHDVFVRDRQEATTVKASVNWAGTTGNSDSGGPLISANGRFVAFTSNATNLVPADTNSEPDVFVHDLDGGPTFTSLCEPGVAGVIACPCGNPPSGPGRGCDNSSATGGAVLSASGGTYLSSDSLVFTTTAEKPTALSIVSQWTGPNATGVVLGMGVRCTSGALKRLYTKSAVGGSISAPNLGAGDPQVSVRSAALGNTILAGQSRWYYVYYRDPVVLGGCPAFATFNATQTGQVTWSP